tara:strand:- start:90 stop:371 length:282 start_codon:yes stop_codon:yes gene_type:complete
MAITTTWDVTSLRRDSTDKVTTISYLVTAKEGSKESDAQGSVEIDGDVTVAFKDITKDTAITWAKNALGDEVASIEGMLSKDLTETSGVPWIS